jgi:hypothetical protein
VTLPNLLVVGDVTNWYVGDVTNWYQSQGFDTEPGWAMLVVSETRFQSELLSKGTKI